MSCRFLDAGAVELYFYGELPSAGLLRVDRRGPPVSGGAPDVSRPEFEAHLAACRECRQALDDLTMIRAALASCPDVATPPGADWSGFMARLESSLASERRLREHGAGPARPPARRTARVLPVAAAAVLALAAIASLLFIRDTAGPAEAPSGVDAALQAGAPRDAAPAAPRVSPASTTAADPALVSLSDQHFERSKLVVLAIATRSADQADGDAWAFERDLAGTLLGDTRVYRQAAEARGMEPLADVMRDLEFVLLQTSMSEGSDTESIERLQQLIRRQDLLTKMNAVYTER